MLNNDQIIQKVLVIPLTIFAQEDTYCWGLTGLGTFSTRSITWVAHKSFGH